MADEGVTKPTVLLCEDEEALRVLYEEDLSDAGYHVLMAENGKQAIAMAEKESPDLVILDIRMPGMDGLEAMGKILSQDNQTPIVLNTAYSNYKENFLSWSADAYVVKSHDTSELLNTVARVLADRKNKTAS